MNESTTCCLALPIKFRGDAVVNDFSKLSGSIAIFGGSFDPIQSSHVELALRVQQTLKIDSVVFIPAKQNPLKENKPAPDDIRQKMIELAIQFTPSLHVSPIEFQRTEVSYSINTVSDIRSQLKDPNQLYMIIGCDCLKNLHRWNRIHELLKIVKLIVVRRSGEPGVEQAYSFLRENFSDLEIARLKKYELDLNITPYSSSEARKAVQEGNLFSAHLPFGVKQQIFKHQLYSKVSC